MVLKLSGAVLTYMDPEWCLLAADGGAVLTYMDPEWRLSATDGVEAKGCSAHRTDGD